ncbi:UTP21 [Candida metapsilosis]|uniref:mRNA 3'-end-processing protein YTH1 n=1 Tax=Candida metapsilosis TaxID=273372 RepID=A0A8H8DAZ8_9ASCO|nr:UTP21 [Candida metapsilosis]
MVELLDKRRRVEGTGPQKAPKPSRIFSPFRVLGNVTDSTPFAIGTLGSTFYAVTSTGRTFQIYDLATLHLLFVSQKQTKSKITCFATHHHYVFAAYGNEIGIFRRGRLEETLTCETTGVLTHLCYFGEYLVAGSTEGDLFVFKKSQGSKYPTELYSVIKAVNTSVDGTIVGIVHPPTYLNKIAVATSTSVLIVNVRSGKVLFRLPQHQFGDEVLSCIECAPALDIAAVGTTTGNVFIFNMRKGTILGDKIVTSGSESSSKVTSISFRTDGQSHLVASLNNGDLYFHDLEKNSRVHILRNAHKESFGGVAKAQFLNGQPIVLTNGGDNHLKEFVFDPSLTTTNSSIITPPRHLRSRGGHSAPPVAIAFPEEDKTHFLLSASRDRSFWSFSLRKDAQAQEFSQRLHKSKDGKRQAGVVGSLKEKFPEIIAVSSSEARTGDWENIITAHKDEPFARTWDSSTKRVGRNVLNTVDQGLCKSVCISQCGNFGLVGSSLGGIGVYNLQSGLLRKKYMLHKQAVTGLAIDGMNRKMVSTGLDGVVGFYDFGKSKYLGKLQLDAPITTMVYHKQSDLIACTLDDLSIVVIDVSTQKVVRVLIGHSNRISGLDFSPDGRWIVSVGLDSTLRTWDLPTGGCIDGVILPVVATSVKFSPIGDLIATTHVSGNGISLWTNRAQFKPVSTRHIEEDEFSTILLPNAAGDGGSTVLDGALDEEQDQDEYALGKYETKNQIDDSLITLSQGPRTKFSTLLHLDTIKQNNKPKAAVKKPEKAPFFLSLSGEAVGDRASVAEGVKHKDAHESTEENSRLLSLKEENGHAFESEFTKTLRSSAEAKDYDAFLSYLVGLPPATLDLEIRSLNAQPPYEEMTNFITALIVGLKSNSNFELIETIFSLYLKVHGDVVHQNDESSELRAAIAEYSQKSQEMSEKMDEAFKYCSNILEPSTRLRISHFRQSTSKTTSVLQLEDRIYVGCSNGDLLVFTASGQPDADKGQEYPTLNSTASTVQSSATRSVRSFKSYADTRNLFADDHGYTLSATFKNLTIDGSAISSIQILPIVNPQPNTQKTIVLITSISGLKIYELVGSHTNLIYSFDETKFANPFYVEHDGSRILIIGYRKKLLILSIKNKSRNVLQFNKVKEMSLKDRIRTINTYNGGELLLGTESDYFLLSVDNFELRSLSGDGHPDIFTHATSFTYFGLSASDPSVWTLPTDGNLVILIKDTTVVQLDKKTNEISTSPIKLSTIPLGVLSISPMYLVAIYSKRLEVIDLKGSVIQKFSHHIMSSSIVSDFNGSTLILASGSNIFHFNVVAYQQQLTQFLGVSGRVSGPSRQQDNDLKLMGLEKAIQLVSLLPAESGEFFNSLKSKELKLRELYKLKAIYLFDAYSKFHESLVDIGCEWLLPFRDVLALFPAFLNAETQLGGNEDGRDTRVPITNPVKNVTIEDLELNPITESEYETDATAKKSIKPVKRSLKQQNTRRFAKAVNNLIIYLTEQRRILLQFHGKRSIQWRDVELEPIDIYPAVENQLEQVSIIIDTSLFLCYFHCKPMLLGPLLRLPNNKCDSKIVHECLMSNVHNHIQQRNLKQPNFIKELLDFYYGRGLHREALEMMYNLAHDDKQVNHSNEDDNNYDDIIKSPLLTVQYLSKLTNEHLSLILEYAKWVIDADSSNSEKLFMNDSYECESYDSEMIYQFFIKRKAYGTAIRYLEWLLYESDVKDKLKRSKHFSAFETKLCCLYLKEISSEVNVDEYYERLSKILQSSEFYDPWPVLKDIPTTENKMLRLTVFVYKRLEEHEKAIDVLYNQLNDLDSAMSYCSTIYEKPNGVTLGTSLFHKLLEDLLVNFKENVDDIATLLSREGSKLSIHKVFELLPPSFPLKKLSSYLVNSVQKVDTKVHESRMGAQLYKVGSTNLKYKVLNLQDEGYKINSSKQKCSICNERLGYGYFTFETFLRNEYNFGLNPDRPICPLYNPHNPQSCPLGSNCPNKHVSQMYFNKVVCKHWLRGLCKKGDHCEFLHEYNLRKMPECLFYSKNGFCTQGSECLYQHIDPQSKIPECMNYNAGFCAEGPNCKNRHVRRTICPYYMAGFCPKGPECEHTHPRFDYHNLYLRIKPDPIRATQSQEVESESNGDGNGNGNGQIEGASGDSNAIAV